MNTMKTLLKINNAFCHDPCFCRFSYFASDTKSVSTINLLLFNFAGNSFPKTWQWDWGLIWQRFCKAKIAWRTVSNWLADTAACQPIVRHTTYVFNNAVDNSLKWECIILAANYTIRSKVSHQAVNDIIIVIGLRSVFSCLHGFYGAHWLPYAARCWDLLKANVIGILCTFL